MVAKDQQNLAEKRQTLGNGGRAEGLRNPVDCSLPGSSIHGIFQARVLEWAAIVK